jgi:hypothetical protein
MKISKFTDKNKKLRSLPVKLLFLNLIVEILILEYPDSKAFERQYHTQMIESERYNNQNQNFSSSIVLLVQYLIQY